MMKTGCKYGPEMDAVAVSSEIQGSMPIWYHRKSYANRHLYNQGVEVVECLRKNHKVKLVRDAVTLGAKRDALRHRSQKSCKCATCRITRAITGGVYYTRTVHRLNSKFTEDKQVVLYGWLSLQNPTRCQPSTTLFQGVNHTRHWQSGDWPAV
jgi:hypothetical protein